MENKTLISTIIPVRNGEKYIDEAIQSIANQKFNNEMEIIVVDDGSTDNTQKIVERIIETRHDTSLLNIRYFRKEPAGAIVARNFGFKQAKGDFILFHDADDTLNPDTLQTLYNHFITDSKIQIVLALRKDFYSPEITEEEKRRIPIRAEGYSGAIAGCALIRRQVFDAVGLFDENLKMAGDAIEWLMRLEKHEIKTLKINFIAVNRRIHQDNMGRTATVEQHLDYAAILRQRLKK